MNGLASVAGRQETGSEAVGEGLVGIKSGLISDSWRQTAEGVPAPGFLPGVVNVGTQIRAGQPLASGKI